MDCLFWNCRGTTSSIFLASLVYLLSMYRPSILLFVETKVYSSAANIILQNSNFNKICTAEANGFSSGIWVSFEDGCLDLESIHTQIVTMDVK